MIRVLLGFILLPALLLGSVVVSDISYAALDQRADKEFRSGLSEAGGTATEDCQDAGGTIKDDSICVDKNGKQISSVSKTIQDIINILLYVAGATATLMIVIGGFRYVTSNGDPPAASKAKNTIIYALIGLVVAVMAYSIVNFILSNI